MMGCAGILVTGAGGFVGRAVVARLARDGETVVATGRRQPAPVPPGVTAVATCDIATADWPAVLTGIDAVVHCAARAHVLREEAADPLAAFRAVNRDATLALARAAAAAGVRRFVFLSSIGVNGNLTGATGFAATDPPQPHSPYAIAKWEAEQGLAAIARDAGLEVVVIRPPLVIGRDPKGNLGSLVAAMRRGLPLPLGSVRRNRRDLVSLETLADLVARALRHPRAPGEPLMVAEAAPLSTRGVVERLATLHGLTPRLIPVPAAMLGVGLRLAGRRALAEQLLGNLEVDMTDTRHRLDWSPPRAKAAIPAAAPIPAVAV